jgi:hypothetical protein
MKTIGANPLWPSLISVPSYRERPARAAHIETPSQQLYNACAHLHRRDALEWKMVADLDDTTFTGHYMDCAIDSHDGGVSIYFQGASSADYYRRDIRHLESIAADLPSSGSNTGTRFRAACINGLGGANGRACALRIKSSTYYVSIATSTLPPGTWSEVSTGRASSVEPSHPEVLYDPSTGKYWSRIGQYVQRISPGTPPTLDFNADCGCGSPASVVPHLAAYGPLAVVGYHSAAEYIASRVYDDNTALWSDGAAIDTSVDLDLIAIGYDPYAGHWRTVNERGTVYTSTDPKTEWTKTGNALLTSSDNDQQAWVIPGGVTVLYYARTGLSDTRTFAISYDHGASWELFQLYHNADPDIKWGGRHFYYMTGCKVWRLPVGDRQLWTL